MQWKSWFLLISFIDAFDAFVLCCYFGSCFFCLVLPNFSLICENDWQSIQSKATFPVYHGLFMLSCSTFVTGNELSLASIYLQIRIWWFSGNKASTVIMHLEFGVVVTFLVIVDVVSWAGIQLRYSIELMFFFCGFFTV